MSIYNYLKTNQLTVFFTVLIFYPSIRLLTIGSDHAVGLSLIVGLVPECLFLIICSYSLVFLFKDKNRKTHLLDKLVIAYFLYNLLIGVYLSHDLRASLYGFRLTYLPMLAYFVGSYYWDKKIDIEGVLHGFFKILVLVAVIGLIIYFLFPEIHLYFHRLSSDKPIVMAFKGFIRMTSILWTPVVFGMVMLAAFCYWAYRYLKTGNYFALLFALITVNTVFFSVSRGPMIASFVAFVLLLFLGKEQKFKWILIALVLLELTLFYLFVPQFSQLMEWFFESSKQTATLEAANTRVSLWSEVMNS
ncbi:MAG TPA: O-antigen ligase family protein, partial [Bacteroidia bacterium]